MYVKYSVLSSYWVAKWLTHISLTAKVCVWIPAAGSKVSKAVKIDTSFCLEQDDGKRIREDTYHIILNRPGKRRAQVNYS